MLNLFRQHANNWFMVLIFAVITFVFVFTFGSWGGGNVSGQMAVAATVNGHAISASQFRNQYQGALRNMQMYQPGFTPEKAREQGLDKKVLDHLVDQELLAQMAEDRGITVADDELADLIHKQLFGADKPFDEKEYKRLVNGYFQTSEARFEDQKRREILASRISSAIEDAQHVSATEVKDAFESRNDRVDLDVIRIDPAAFKDGAKEVSDADVAKFESEKSADVEAFYTEHLNRYHQPKKVAARHILIKVAETASDADKAKAKERIDAAKKRVDGGEDFAKVASEMSEDSSKSQGGSLGTFGPGAMVKPFEDAAFALKAGQVSDVVTTRYGYHVIKVDSVEEPVTRELKEVKGEIAKQLVRERAQLTEAKKIANAALTELKAGTAPASLKVPGLLEPGADGAMPKSDDPSAPTLQSTGWFAKNARYVPRVGVSPELVKAAFELTPESPVVREVMEIQGRLYVVKLKTREKPDDTKLNDERDTIESGLLAQRRARAVEEFVKIAREKAKIDKSTQLFAQANTSGND